MNDAVSKQPTLDEEMASFKGFTTVDGERRLETPAEKDMAARVAAEAGENAGDTPAVAVPPAAKTAPGTPPAAVPPVNKAEARIKQAVARQRAAERELSDLRAKYEPLTAPVKAATTVDAPPKPADPKYKYGELDTQYIADVTRYSTLKTIREERETETQTRAEQARVTAASEARDKARSFLDKGNEQFDDFEDLITSPDLKMSETIASLLFESDHGIEIAHQLASDLDEATRISGLAPHRQAAWFGAKEAELSSKSQDAGAVPPKEAPAPKTTQAPPLLQNSRRSSGGSGKSVSGDTPDFAAFEQLAMGNLAQ